jgi:outer membrane protein TolC
MMRLCRLRKIGGVAVCLAAGWGGVAVTRGEPLELLPPPSVLKSLRRVPPESQEPPRQRLTLPQIPDPEPLPLEPLEPLEPVEPLEVLERLPPVEAAEEQFSGVQGSLGDDFLPAPPEVLAPQPRMWWEPAVFQPLGDRSRSVLVDVQSLMELVLESSQQVKAVEVTRWIRNAQTTIAEADFDPEGYADARFDDTSDPVGNSLVTGGPPRLNEHRARFEAGVRRRTYSGASVSLSQRLGHDNSNSLFFIPDNQGNARMFLEMRQPLLEGRGRDYNRSFVVETVFQSDQAQAEYLKTLQDQLFDVGTAYWALYRARVLLIQQRQHVARASGIAEELAQRQILDALRSQVLRAQAAVATRESDLAVAAAEVRNAESRIEALVNAGEWRQRVFPELIPAQLPPERDLVPDVDADVSQALRRRPEMRALAAQLQAADVRIAQAVNEKLPTLDVVLESYLAGLEGDSRVGAAWRQQFADGSPGYAAGLQFSAPFGNRAAEARLRQRRWEQTRIGHLMNAQADQIRAEVEIAARNASAAYQTAEARTLAVAAINAEMEYLNERWHHLRGDPDLGQLQLDDLLNAQDRLFQEEKALAAAQVAYGIALLELQRSSGALVSVPTP